MIRSMYIQSGEWVIILEVKKYIKSGPGKSLRLRIILIIIIAGILPATIMKSVILNCYEKRAVEVRTADIQSQCTILCDQFDDITHQNLVASEVLNAEMIQLSNIYNGRIMLIDNEYHIVYDTYDMDVGKTIISEDVIMCFQGEGTSYYDAENKYIEVTAPIIDDTSEQVKGVMLVSVSTDMIEDSLVILDAKSKIISVAIIIIMIVFAIICGFKMTRPFKRMTKSIEAITEGYEDDFIRENAYVETIQISEAINKMLGRLKALDESRQQFVSNVSHELKTPLTSMKVLADSLLIQGDAPVELYKEFMGDLSEEIERENKIINDLLSLVKMDKTEKALNITTENINELGEKILKRLRPIAATQNVEVIFESFRPVTAEIDETKLSLAITNLVENAIKYNKEKGWVHVLLNADHKYFYLEVADSGMGIPEEDIEHVFERFYRVDKSHSREIGGTGLGLSIARNAVLMHRGAIKVYSQVGEGTTFTVRIPISYVS